MRLCSPAHCSQLFGCRDLFLHSSSSPCSPSSSSSSPHLSVQAKAFVADPTAFAALVQAPQEEAAAPQEEAKEEKKEESEEESDDDMGFGLFD